MRTLWWMPGNGVRLDVLRQKGLKMEKLGTDIYKTSTGFTIETQYHDGLIYVQDEHQLLQAWTELGFNEEELMLALDVAKQGDHNHLNFGINGYFIFSQTSDLAQIKGVFGGESRILH